MLDRERPVARVEIRNQAAGFKCRRNLPLEPQFLVDDEVGLGKCLGRVARFD